MDANAIVRDNIYGGKLMRIERQIHHYGSGLNALPLISQFESDPSDFYLLRVGFGGSPHFFVIFSLQH